MPFFYKKSYPSNEQRTPWLRVIIGLSLTVIVSTSAIAYVKSTSKPENLIPASSVIDRVFVDKSDRVLKLMSDGKVIRSYRIALRNSPSGHKQQEGDQRTPVGVYTLDYKNADSIAHRSIHISYPNDEDKARAQSLGVNPGGDIMIHGQMNGFGYLALFNQRRDWTDGCIAVANDEMDEIMDAVTLGIPIEIVE
ncbi:L,D-transpeptidase family protein [Psychrobacter sp. APC 3281]|uniref:L,D-transpeptidase family protein n=1 Tax=Psychrobacter sp. APC 3281 TaxID=3035190 RepID=UPI0025B32A79|nr:L,D-transpeptidase family protein [Psychrobacter sp. APC 3281]MDN3446717.1 L,D-transpeptidase family protein [Psychrobacter sp. APC 3281]